MNIGFIGFGEAAFHISKGLIQEGVPPIYAYDINLDHPSFGPIIKKRATEANVVLVPTLEELIRTCSFVLSATSAGVAVKIAKECMDLLDDSHTYVDLNAASPEAKKEIAGCLEERMTSFVDAAVMGSIPQQNHKVPILLSGDGAEYFEAFGERYGMNLTIVGPVPGDASAIKMVRSVFMKGFTMLLVASLIASHKFGIKEYMIQSINETLQSTSLERLAQGLITRTAVHAKRRVAEMDEVISTLQSVKVDPVMSLATRSALQSIVKKALTEYFDYQPPDNFMDVINALSKKEHSC